MWLRWHHKFADGPGDVEYLNIGSYCSGMPSKDVLDEIIHDLSLGLFEWSENYRGISYEIVDVPRNDVGQHERVYYPNNTVTNVTMKDDESTMNSNDLARVIADQLAELSAALKESHEAETHLQDAIVEKVNASVSESNARERVKKADRALAKARNAIDHALYPLKPINKDI